MLMDVRLPKLGEGAEGGAVVSILVKEGDRVTQGQTILELENEKAVAPIPSTVSGVIRRVCVREGDRVAVGQVVLEVAESGPAPASPKPVESPRTAPAPTPVERKKALPGVEPAPVPASGGLPPAAAPEGRRLVRLLGIDLRRVPGSDGGGRIVVADLRAYVQQLETLAAAP